MNRHSVPPLPEIAAPHWAAAAHGEVSLPHCRQCKTRFFPPTRFCPNCLADDVAWVSVEGHGVITGWCTFHKPYYADFWLPLPYDVILIRLDAGPQLFSNLLGDVAPAVGMRVEPVFTRISDQQGVVQFRPER
jgi:uncharacterized OB-fold protein